MPAIVGLIVGTGLVASFVNSLLPSTLPGPDAAAEMAMWFFLPLAFALFLSLGSAVLSIFFWRRIGSRARRNGLIPLGALVLLVILIELLPAVG